MTTTVTITTHDWGVSVIRRENGAETGTRVEPHSHAQFAVWQGSDLAIKELPLESRPDFE